MKKDGFSVIKTLIICALVAVLAIISLVIVYFSSIKGTNGKEDVTVSIVEGDTYSSIVNKLYTSGLIKNKTTYKVYLKLNKPETLQQGTYLLNPKYSVKEIIEFMENGEHIIKETKNVTFVEGKNMRYVINKITEEFAIKEDDILSVLSDSDYLDSIIDKYWFLTEDIKNKDIYYSLEGYLYPDTYEFYTDSSIKDIFKTMLDNMDKKLKPYKEEIEKSKHSIHEMITLSSIIELEAGKADDRKGVAGVFYNRLEDGWSLGSDVTTYYASKIDLADRDLKQSELSNCNAYNTRATCMAGKLPVGPICNASVGSLVAAIEPTSHNYYYFVADKNGKTYFNKNSSGHTSTVSKLKKDGLWYEYED